MQAADMGASDGSTVIDQLWKRRLQKALDEEPIAASLKEAVESLPGIDHGDLEAIIDGQCDADGTDGQQRSWQASSHCSATNVLD